MLQIQLRRSSTKDGDFAQPSPLVQVKSGWMSAAGQDTSHVNLPEK
jgi:hypothetical protein